MRAQRTEEGIQQSFSRNWAEAIAHGFPHPPRRFYPDPSSSWYKNIKRATNLAYIAITHCKKIAPPHLPDQDLDRYCIHIWGGRGRNNSKSNKLRPKINDFAIERYFHLMRSKRTNYDQAVVTALFNMPCQPHKAAVQAKYSSTNNRKNKWLDKESNIKRIISDLHELSQVSIRFKKIKYQLIPWWKRFRATYTRCAGKILIEPRITFWLMLHKYKILTCQRRQDYQEK